MRWVRDVYHQYQDTPLTIHDVTEVEIDEMCSYIGKKNRNSGSGKYSVIIPEGLLGGFVAIVVQKH
jgi:hypothetical protein